MKTSSILLAAALSTVGLAWADHHDSSYHDGVTNPKNINQQQLSRRPYAVTPAGNPDVINSIIDQKTKAANERTYKTLQLHSLGRRPYAEKNTE
jgi:hypothetical protein